MRKIAVFTTGGTIDKVYFDANSDYKVGEPLISSLLKKFKVNFDFEVRTLFRKDSLDLTPDDRQQIFKAVEESKQTKILITHGTDTLVDTASVLSSIKDKTIVLTGALLPATFKETDAEFNIGTALGVLWSQGPGVFVAMNGCVFPWHDVVKNRSKGKFENL
ncbi:MAG: asparaginase domain-containing protein [Lentisphaerales bacterium]|nr:asparaginase domain-containing protein [Lentisphaerales bacterium]